MAEDRRLPKSSLVLTCLQVNLREWVPNDTLRRTADMDDVTRCIREKRQEGWPIEKAPGGKAYRLTSLTKGPPRTDGTHFTAAQKKQIRERDGGRCRFCGRAAGDPDIYGNPVHLQFDHIIPRDEGGPSTIDNGQTLCGPCHKEKGAKES